MDEKINQIKPNACQSSELENLVIKTPLP